MSVGVIVFVCVRLKDFSLGSCVVVVDVVVEEVLP